MNLKNNLNDKNKVLKASTYSRVFFIITFLLLILYFFVGFAHSIISVFVLVAFLIPFSLIVLIYVSRNKNKALKNSIYFSLFFITILFLLLLTYFFVGFPYSIFGGFVPVIFLIPFSFVVLIYVSRNKNKDVKDQNGVVVSKLFPDKKVINLLVSILKFFLTISFIVIGYIVLSTYISERYTKKQNQYLEDIARNNSSLIQQDHR